jgi:hypothetical protein
MNMSEKTKEHLPEIYLANRPIIYAHHPSHANHFQSGGQTWEVILQFLHTRGREMNISENTKEPLTEHSLAGIPIMY